MSADFDSVPDIIALPWAEAERRLIEAGCRYTTEITRPTRDFFKTDESRLYTVRVRRHENELLVTLAAKQQPCV